MLVGWEIAPPPSLYRHADTLLDAADERGDNRHCGADQPMGSAAIAVMLATVDDGRRDERSGVTSNVVRHNVEQHEASQNELAPTSNEASGREWQCCSKMPGD